MTEFTKIEVEGARELRRAIRKMEASGLDVELKTANKEAADTVAQRARERHVPVRDGDLKRAIRGLGSKTKAQVKAGGARGGTRDYAGVIHYGDPKRGIEPQPFLHQAASDEWKEVRKKYEAALNRIADELSSR